jgi:hypothetical protein
MKKRTYLLLIALIVVAVGLMFSAFYDAKEPVKEEPEPNEIDQDSSDKINTAANVVKESVINSDLPK